MRKTKQTAEVDILSQEKTYRTHFGNWNVDEMKRIQELLKTRNITSFLRLFIDNVKQFWNNTLDLMDQMKSKSLQEASQSLITQLYYQLQNEKTPRIDW